MHYINLFPIVGLLGLVSAGLIYLYLRKIKVTTPKMVEIADAIHEGAMIFLRREYSILAVFVVLVFLFWVMLD